jgi:nucleotidyltransferase substrate binding protein (TIGR01987 family)
MSDEVERGVGDLGRALDRLREAFQEPESNPLAVDGAIQRFEFTIELFWKVLRRLLLLEGIETSTPREALQRAYQIGWLTDEATWLGLLRRRNETSHTYREELARAVYLDVKGALPEMERAFAIVRQRAQDLAGGTPRAG